MWVTSDGGDSRGETYDDSEPLTGSDEALGLVDFSVLPHLERESMPDTSLATIARWAAGLSVPAYAIDDRPRYEWSAATATWSPRDTGSCSPPSPEAS